MRVRRRHRLRKALAWGFLALLASLAGGLLFAYHYAVDSDNLARTVKAILPRYLPGSLIDLGRVQFKPFKGEIHLPHLHVRQVIDGRPFLAVKIPWLNVRFNPREMLEGRFEPSEVVVAQPTLRLIRRADGTWNLQGLLASPWPGPVMKTPPIQILNGTVELVEGLPNSPATAILRDVSAKVEGAGEGTLTFEGTAKGDTFDRVSIKGTVDIRSGRVELAGDVARLAISDPLRSRIPAEWKPGVEQLGLTGGEVDLTVGRIVFDPGASPPIRYAVSGRLRGGVWNCPKLPFPLNDLTTGFAAQDGVFTVARAEGFYGTTVVRVESGSFSLTDLERGPLALKLEVVDLKLDERLQSKTPPPLDAIWREFRPKGRVTVRAGVVRKAVGAPIQSRVEVDCLDVALLYEFFKYPVDHVNGQLVWEGDRVTVVNMQTLVGGHPLTVRGTVDHPGPDAVARLEFAGQSLPVDKALFDALPPEVRAVVNDFSPTGSVSGTLSLLRTPPKTPDDDPHGVVKIDAYLDLNERCGITWKDLPYPINNLTGRLEIHPDLWVFKNMRGVNGQAVITGSGKVQKVGGTPQKPDLVVDLELHAEKLPFDDQLRESLPPAWKKSWAALSPNGSSDVDARIAVRPGAPDSYVLRIRPRAATSVTLKYTRTPKPGIDPGGTFLLPMEHVTGEFVFNNGPVDMQNVGFRFYGAPVQFARGRVVVKDSGEFKLGVEDLWVKEIRLDRRLRALMPPVMDQFAQRLDDGRTFTLKGDLGLGWPGPGSAVWCSWNKALVVFNDNTVRLQPGIDLEHIQGKVDHVRGWTDGETLDLHGAMRLESVSLLGQQITRLESPIDVEGGAARLSDLQGDLLGGTLTGKLGVSLDATPRYTAQVAVRGADLQRYAKTLPGRQTFRGLVDARLELTGFGGDPRTLQGSGEAYVVKGDLGELPTAFRLLKALKLSPATKTAFDAAEIKLAIRDGKSYLDPVHFTGDAFSLHGKGTMDIQGDLALRLRVLYGRDRIHVRGFSDLLREASGQIFVVAVSGTPALPWFKLEVFPEAADALKSFGQARNEPRQSSRR